MSTLKQTMLTGVFWSAVEKYSAFFISLIISAILARILSPLEYGVVTVASVIIDFFALFVSMGIGHILYLEPHNNQKQSEISKRKSLITNTFYKLTLFGCFLSLPKFPHIFDTYF